MVPLAVKKASQSYLKMCNTYGPLESKTLEALERWANQCMEHDLFEDAARHYEMLIDCFRKTGQDEQMVFFYSQERLANAWFKLNRQEESLDLYQKLYPNCRDRYSFQHLLTGTVLIGYLNVLVEARDAQTARKFIEPIFLEMDIDSSFEPYLMFAIAEKYAAVLVKTGDVVPAVGLMEEVHQSMVRLYGANHELTLEAARLLVMKYKDAGKYIDALRLANQLLDQKRRMYGSNSSELLTTLLVIYRIYEDAGFYMDSHKMLMNIITNPLYRIPKHENVLLELEQIYRAEYEMMVKARQQLQVIENLKSQIKPGTTAMATMEAKVHEFRVVCGKLLLIDLQHPDELFTRT